MLLYQREASNTHHSPSLSRRDVLYLALSLLALVATFLYLSSGRQLWSDEVFSWLLVKDPSLPHMIQAWRLGADGGGIIFYLIARLWTACLGGSVLAYRSLNVCGMAVSLIFAWAAARRWYSTEVVAASFTFCWLTCCPLLQQLIIGRFYGLLLAAVSATIWCFASVQVRLSMPMILGTFLAHGILVGIHPFGLIYSAAVIALNITVDLLAHRFRPSLYVAAFLGWLILWPSRAAMQASAAIAKPHFWTSAPTLWDLIYGLALWTDEFLYFGLLLVLTLAAITFVRHPFHRSDDAPAIAAGLWLMTIIPFVWVVSLHGTSYFVDRYLLPSLIGSALLLCAIIVRLRSVRYPTRLKPVIALVIAGVIGGVLYSDLIDIPSSLVIPPHPYSQAMAALLPPKLPVVVERVDIFTEVAAIDPSLPVHYLLDWDIVMLPQSPRGDVSGFHEMHNISAAGYFPGRIQDYARFLSDNSDFLVVTDPSGQWFRQRILNNSSFTTERLGEFHREKDTETVFRVHHVTTSPR